MRTYSSGMQARLRFAIAASVTHRVLLIDEALAVGDAKFQRRSEERIRELRSEAGTVFLVSHSLKSVLDTCERALWIDKGILRADGPAGEVVEAYQASVR
jgi:teichoic acid transport system ATP-binding protein